MTRSILEKRGFAIEKMTRWACQNEPKIEQPIEIGKLLLNGNLFFCRASIMIASGIHLRKSPRGEGGGGTACQLE